MSKKYEYAIVIGRFQPVHKGHDALFALAKDLAEKVIIVVGSHNQSRTAKNPFTSEERTEFIQASLGFQPPAPMYNIPGFGMVLTSGFSSQTLPYIGSQPKILRPEDIFSFISVEDVTYQDTEWSLAVQNQIYRITGVNAKICLVGADKDSTTYYLKKHFKMWDFIESKLLSVGAVDATTVRQSLFDSNHKFEEMKPYLSDVVYNAIEQWKVIKKHEFDRLCSEHAFLVKTRKESQVGAHLDQFLDTLRKELFPEMAGKTQEKFETICKEHLAFNKYPVQFLAADAVVFYGGSVLLVQRKGPLGNGLWALPGGYVEDNETFFDCAIRELTEETKIDIPEKVLRSSFVTSHVFDAPGRSLRGRIATTAHGFLLDPTFKRPNVSNHPLPQTQSTDETYKAWWFSFGEIYQMRHMIFEDHFDIITWMISHISNRK